MNGEGEGGGMKATVLDFRDFAGNVLYYLAAPFRTCWDCGYFCYYFAWLIYS